MKYIMAGIVLGILSAAFINEASADYRCHHCKYEQPASPQVVSQSEFNWSKAFAVSGATSAANNFGMENYKLQFTGGWGWQEGEHGFALGIGKNTDGFLIHGTIGATFDGDAKQASAGFRIDFD